AAPVPRVGRLEALLAHGNAGSDAEMRRVDRITALARADRRRVELFREAKHVGVAGEVFRRPDLDAIVEESGCGRRRRQAEDARGESPDEGGATSSASGRLQGSRFRGCHWWSHGTGWESKGCGCA